MLAAGANALHTGNTSVSSLIPAPCPSHCPQSMLQASRSNLMRFTTLSNNVCKCANWVDISYLCICTKSLHLRSCYTSSLIIATGRLSRILRTALICQMGSIVLLPSKVLSVPCIGSFGCDSLPTGCCRCGTVWQVFELELQCPRRHHRTSHTHCHRQAAACEHARTNCVMICSRRVGAGLPSMNGNRAAAPHLLRVAGSAKLGKV